ncbi:hypothetical protein B5E84_12895 [Lachnoclostridium sp. An14]|uniref:hypothetical protein n=1 Tax=Lachnoclostridium sp. An14 TaxID=1965562 RepID=UPI000B39AB70|nr:hypothetical protein [Lachnoclostridium sp. An14]OUQ16072.1 hypothetical protein B5E84_12895 [Lachnoclostridium sp. An14]
MLLMWRDRENIEIGREIGYAERYAEGYAEGYAKGFAEGLAEGMARTAKIIRLHVDGLAANEIAARLCLDPHIVEYTIQKFTEVS